MGTGACSDVCGGGVGGWGGGGSLFLAYALRCSTLTLGECCLHDNAAVTCKRKGGSAPQYEASPGQRPIIRNPRWVLRYLPCLHNPCSCSLRLPQGPHHPPGELDLDWPPLRSLGQLQVPPGAVHKAGDGGAIGPRCGCLLLELLHCLRRERQCGQAPASGLASGSIENGGFGTVLPPLQTRPPSTPGYMNW